jgi:putative nucleotidyltransferase with HDIG domain
MSDAALFLTGLAQALATMTLYSEGHPARERVIDASYHALMDLQDKLSRPVFTFLGDEIVCGTEPVRDLKAWDWGARLAAAGVQRLEFEPGVSREDFEEFLEEVLARLTLSAISSADARQMRRSRIRFGTVGVKGEITEAPASEPEETASYSLNAEADTIRWLHEQLQNRNELHLSEAEAVVRSLSVAMHGDRQMMIPLLRLRSFDEYTTTHCLNVSVLAMALAEYVGLAANDVRAFGVAGLLHDIGKVNIPHDILTKPGKLTPEERNIMNMHTVDGARIIIETEEHLDLAAVVAYEHHIMIDGGGYPTLAFPRDAHYASKIVHVCDVYDALRTNRPYRDAWSSEKVIAYMQEKAGTEFDAELSIAFVAMMEKFEGRIRIAQHENEPVIEATPATAPAPTP